MQSDSDIQILTFTFQCKYKELYSSVTFGQLFKMEFKTFLCCGKQFNQVIWINNDQVINPNEDDQISQYIKNGDDVQCQLTVKQKTQTTDYQRYEDHSTKMLAGLNGPDFHNEYQKDTQQNAQITKIIQETIYQTN